LTGVSAVLDSSGRPRFVNLRRVSILRREDFRTVPGTCVIGLQWGDEAKGKLVDILTEDHDIVVRYAGGANAGHTVVSGGQTWKLSIIPSGILRDGVACVVTGGVVLDPAKAIEEMDGLESRGIRMEGKLRFSDRAHIVFPWHVAEDRILDGSLSGGGAIGTTGRGIGPCYRDKVGRALAIRLGDLYRADFRARVEHVVDFKNRLLANWQPDAPPLDAAAIHSTYAGYAERLRPLVSDTTAFLLDSVEQGKRVLFEGAQGALLDIDHGTFPFVTSSNSSGVGVSSGSGVPGRWIDRVIGVVKAYSTRVGGGPLPTEQDNPIGMHLRERGREYGTVTRRPRRCGWFDAVAARYTARLSGVDHLAVMLLDVLGGLDELRICSAYEIDGRRVTQFPSQIDDLQRAVPVYETLPGWREELQDVRDEATLPENARRYVERIGELLGRPVAIVSVGPDRDQTIFRSAENMRRPPWQRPQPAPANA
jgi:adenylosuccinate synthase